MAGKFQMTLRESLRNAMGMLAGAGVPSSTTAAEVLLLHILEKDRAYLYAHSEEELTTGNQRDYQDLLERRAAGTPTQYLTGRQEFWGLEFHVEPGVLIPRPETEHVVEVVLRIVREKLMKPNASIVDVGTGSGCIALALAHELPQAEIHAVDISEDALRIARANAKCLGLEGRVSFLHSDLLDVFQNEKEAAPFDVVVSNPPYVNPEEEDQLPREVREHEPGVALFAPEEGLGVTRRLLAQAEKMLAPQTAGLASGGLPSEAQREKEGYVVLELGYNQSQRIQSLLGDAWTEPEITDDLRGIPRVLAARRR